MRAAILAASPHNTQPWLFKVTNSSIELYIDTGRNVGALDPYLREEHIGMGCALENLMLAAAANGYQATVTLLPGKLGPIPAEPKPETPGARRSRRGQTGRRASFTTAIPRRHTNRGAYIPEKPLPPEFIDALSRLTSDEPEVKIFLFTAEADRKKIVEISSAANDEIYSDPEVDRGSDRWIRTIGVRSRNFAMDLRLMLSDCRQSRQQLPRRCLCGCCAGLPREDEKMGIPS